MYSNGLYGSTVDQQTIEKYLQHSWNSQSKLLMHFTALEQYHCEKHS